MNERQFKEVRDNMIWITRWYGLGVNVFPADDFGGRKGMWRAVCGKNSTPRYPYSFWLANVDHDTRDGAIRLAIAEALACAREHKKIHTKLAEVEQFLREVQNMIGKPNSCLR